MHFSQFFLNRLDHVQIEQLQPENSSLHKWKYIIILRLLLCLEIRHVELVRFEHCLQHERAFFDEEHFVWLEIECVVHDLAWLEVLFLEMIAECNEFSVREVIEELVFFNECVAFVDLLRCFEANHIVEIRFF